MLTFALILYSLAAIGFYAIVESKPESFITKVVGAIVWPIILVVTGILWILYLVSRIRVRMDG